MDFLIFSRFLLPITLISFLKWSCTTQSVYEIHRSALSFLVLKRSCTTIAVYKSQHYCNLFTCTTLSGPKQVATLLQSIGLYHRVSLFFMILNAG